MTAIGFILEKVNHGSELSSGEIKIVADELERLMSKLEGCAQEVARREEADKISRQQDRDRAERLRLAEEEVGRLRGALAHEKQQRETKIADRDGHVRKLEGLLRDIHYGLLYQPEHTREQLAHVIAREVTPWPKR
jgi:hypothetical protein